MSERSIGIRVSITRYVSDDPQPGIVECGFFDAHNRYWNFIEKVPIVSREDLHAGTTYPRAGVIACEIVGRQLNAAGESIIVVDTERVWHVHSIDNVSEFELLPSSLVEWDRTSNTEREWNGDV